MYNDPIADFLTRVRNSTLAGKNSVELRPSQIVFEIAKIIQSAGYFNSVEKTDKSIEIILNQNNQISHIKRLSKPGVRYYVKNKNIPRQQGGLGTVVLSTPKGVLSGQQANKQKVGGELICEVW